jgi:hypothetical protein
MSILLSLLRELLGNGSRTHMGSWVTLSLVLVSLYIQRSGIERQVLTDY